MTEMRVRVAMMMMVMKKKMMMMQSTDTHLRVTRFCPSKCRCRLS